MDFGMATRETGGIFQHLADCQLMPKVFCGRFRDSCQHSTAACSLGKFLLIGVEGPH